MRADEIREGDIVEIDYITDFTKEHINEGKALVLWKGFNNQPLIRKYMPYQNEWGTIWGDYEHISKVVGHIDLESYMDKALEQATQQKTGTQVIIDVPEEIYRRQEMKMKKNKEKKESIEL